MKQALFYTFLGVFVATALVTLLGIAGVVAIDKEYLNKLFTCLIIEVIASVVALFKKTEFFGGGSGGSEAEAQVVGSWWELVHGHPTIMLSYVELVVADGQGQLVVDGRTYDKKGARVARWRSEGACLNHVTYSLFFFWKGDELAASDIGKSYSGVGLVVFSKPNGSHRVEEGSGWFTSGNIEELKVDAKRKIDMIRVSPEQLKVMQGEDGKAKGQLALKVYADWSANLPGEG